MDTKDVQDRIEESAFLYFVGLVSTGYAATAVAYWTYRFVMIHFAAPEVDFNNFGKWALVTGSTDGIGKGIAIELAKRGINIVLVSRNPGKLQRVAKEIVDEFHVETKCVAFDFTQRDNGDPSTGVTSVYDVMRNAIKDLDIGILVNNVGKNADSLIEYLKSYQTHKILHKESTNMVNCNIVSTTKVTEIVLPQMLRRQKGLVINISSMSAAVVPSPTFSLYAGTKRFDDTLSRALSYEYEDKGIMVQSIKPGFVVTNLTACRGNIKKGITSPPYLKYTKHMMKTVGKARATSGYWYHHLMVTIVSQLPPKLMVRHRGRANN